jgi:putative hemolysin
MTVAVLLLAVAVLAVAIYRAGGVRKIALAISSPMGELMALPHKRMSQSAWYQNRGLASSARAICGCLWR